MKLHQTSTALHYPRMSEALYKMNALHFIFHFNMTDYPVVMLGSAFVVTLLYFKHSAVLH